MNGNAWIVCVLRLLVNLLLLSGTDHLAGTRSAPGRILAAAVLGTVYSECCLRPWGAFLGGFGWWLGSLLAMSVIAYGVGAGAFKRYAVFVLMTLALEGAALASGKDGILPMALSGLGVWLLSQFVFEGGQTVPVEIIGPKGSVSLTALRDTGNTLRDPVTGEPVLIIGAAPAEKLTGLAPAQLRDPLGTLSCGSVPGLRLIPYHSIGQENGMMLAMRFPHVRVGSSIGTRVVAFAPLGLENGYQALTGGTR